MTVLGVFSKGSFILRAVKLLRSAFDCTYPYKIKDKEIEGYPYKRNLNHILTTNMNLQSIKFYLDKRKSRSKF